jgi:hypothetical protein
VEECGGAACGIVSSASLRQQGQQVRRAVPAASGGLKPFQHAARPGFNVGVAQAKASSSIAAWPS